MSDEKKENELYINRKKIMKNIYHELLSEKNEYITPNTIKLLNALLDIRNVKIFLFTFIHAPVYPGEISTFFKVQKRTMYYQIDNLCKLGILTEKKVIDESVFSIIQKKVLSKEAGTRKLIFYDISELDDFTLSLTLKLCFKIMEKNEINKIINYKRNFDKIDYRIENALKYLKEIKDLEKRDSALVLWANDLKIPPSFLRDKLEVN